MKDCLFCKIAAKEIPSNVIYEDGHTLAFLDIAPVNPGHTLVIPKEHATNIFNISSESWAAVAETARKIAGAVQAATGADGVNVNMNNGEVAGQVIFHTHVHIIPRHENDGLKHWNKKEYEEGEEKEIAKKFVTHFKASMPIKVPRSKNSNIAPPPVEMNDTS